MILDRHQFQIKTTKIHSLIAYSNKIQSLYNFIVVYLRNHIYIRSAKSNYEHSPRSRILFKRLQRKDEVLGCTFSRRSREKCLSIGRFRTSPNRPKSHFRNTRNERLQRRAAGRKTIRRCGYVDIWQNHQETGSLH